MGWTEMAGRIHYAGQKVFGETVVFTPDGGDPQTVTGIFDSEFTYQEMIGETVVETSRPRMILRATDITGTPARADAINVRSTDYSIVEIHPDGQGDLEMLLEKA
jgi:hypothetical protein